MADVATLILEVDGRQVSQGEAALLSLKNASDKAADSAGILAEVYGHLAGAISTAVIIDAVKDVAMLGARYEMLGATMGVMANNAGITRNEMQGIQDDMEKTGISALRARQGLQLMAAAQVDLSKAAELGRVAQDGATLAGINSSEAFAKLVQGISTGESRIIRHMGIMVNFKSSINEYARANHVAVESIDAKTLAEIRMDAVLKEGAKRFGVYEAAMTTAGKQMLSMVRYTENLQVRLGETFNPATTEIVFALVGAFKDASESMKAWQDSGGQATFANNLAEDIKTAIGYVETFVGTLAEMKTSLEMLAAGFAAFKVVQWLQSASVAFHKWASGGIDSFRTMTMSQIQYAASAKVAALADQAAVEAEVAAQKGRFLTNELINRRALANMRVAESDAVLTAAEIRLAEAETLAGQAAIMAGEAIEAMGGPIGLIAIAITVLTAAIMKYRDTSVADAEEDAASADKLIAKWKEEEAQWAELDRIRNKDQKKKKKEEIAINDIPQIRALIDKLNIANAKMAETAAQAGTLKLALKDIWYGLTHFDGEDNDTQGAAQKAARIAADALANAKEEAAKHRKDQKAHEDKEIKAAADRQKADEIQTANAERLLYFKKQMAAMEEKIQDAIAKGSSMSSLELAVNKVRLDTEKEIAGWRAMNADHGKKGDEAPKLAADKMNALIVEAHKAELALIKTLEEANDRKGFDDILSSTEELTKANDDAAKSARELFAAQLEAKNSMLTDSSKLTDAEKLEALNNYMKAFVQNYKNLNDAAMVYEISLTKLNKLRDEGALGPGDYAKLKFGLDDAESGGFLSGNERPEEKYARDLEQLIARKSTMSLTTYERQLIKLKETSGSAWAAMGQVVKGYTDQTSTLLADFFNGTSVNWHKMFSSMVRDMEVAIIKAMIMKPIMDALAASLTSLTKGGGAGFFATFASYFNGSTPAPTGTGSYSNVGSGLNTSGAGGFTGKLGSLAPNSGASAAFSVAATPTSQAKAAQPRGTGDVYLSITVAPNGSAQTQESGSNEQSIAMARSLAAKMREVIMDEQRPTGIIYDFVTGR
jgi:hypothetical protein